MNAVQQALDLARERGLLPSSMTARETAELAATLEGRAFWSARTTHASYLRDLKKLVERWVSGEGYNNDLGRLRMEARALLVRYGYNPEQGFPGDEAMGVPPATPGSLRDLGSEIRLNLIMDTQAALARGLGQKLRGLSRLDTAPAWELVRYTSKAAPRDWPERWQQAVDNVSGAGVYSFRGRMVARKDSPVWAALGSRALFEDALDVDHPPFAFNSGMGWRETFASDLSGVDLIAPGAAGPRGETIEPAVPAYVDPQDFIGGQATIDRLLALRRARRAS